MVTVRCFLRLVPGLLVALEGCSGGGGRSGLTVAMDRTSLEFVSVEGAASQSVNFTLTSGSGAYYAVVVLDRPNLFDANVEFTGPTSATATLTTRTPPAGVTSGSVGFRLCADAGCASVAWERSIPYTVSVFTVGSASLAFAGVEGAAAEPQVVAIAPADTGHLLTATAAGSTPWLAVARDASSSFRVTASAQGLPPGSYGGQIVIAPASGGPGKAIPVSFAVETGIVQPPDATVTLDLAASLSGSIPVAFRGGLTPGWGAVADKPWLYLTRSYGAGDGAIAYEIDPAQLGGVANWSSDVATVRISAGGLTTVSARLTIEIRLPEVYSVSPIELPIGRTATLHVFGRGLSQITSPYGIAVWGDPGVITALPVASDREAVISLPAASGPGQATIYVPNPFSIPTSFVQVLARMEGAWTPMKIASSGEIRSAAYASYGGLYAIDEGQETLAGYRLPAGAPGVQFVPVDAVGDLGLSPDGRTVFVSSGDPLYCAGTLRTFDARTLAPGATTWPLPSGGTCLLSGALRTGGLGMTNDGRVWFPGSSWSDPTYFDARSGAFARHSGPSVLSSSASLYSPTYYASPDGSRMIVAQASGNPAYLYTSADERIALPPIPAVYGGAAWSRDGGVVILGARAVYDAGTWALRGDATVAAGTGTAWGAQVSPDGAKVYVLVGASESAVRVDVFDAAIVVAGTTDLAKIGEIPVVDQASSCGTSPPYGCISAPVFLVGPLGDVFFLVGNQGLVVLPIPAELRGPP